MYVKAEDRFYDLPCVPARQIGSTVGAGDALFSAFLHFYAKGFQLVDALWNAQGFIPEEEVLSRRG